MKALAVGGDRASRGRLRGLLGSARLDLVEAGEAGAGMRALRRERPDVVVLDFDLSDATGFELLDRMREVSEVAVVALVGRVSCGASSAPWASTRSRRCAASATGTGRGRSRRRPAPLRLEARRPVG